MIESKVFENVWDALEDCPEDVAMMTAISDLMIQIQQIVTINSWSVGEAAKHFGVSATRMDYLLKGVVEQFKLEELIGMTARVGRRLRIEIEAA